MNLTGYPVGYYKKEDSEVLKIINPVNNSLLTGLGLDNWQPMVDIDGNHIKEIVDNYGLGYIYWKTKNPNENQYDAIDYFLGKEWEKGMGIYVFDKGLWGIVSIKSPEISEKFKDLLKIGVPIVLIIALLYATKK